MKNLDKLPIACSLTSAELREREATLLAQLKSAIIKTEELQDGYAFHIPGDGERIRQVAELIVAERECCPFLVFEVSALPNMGPVTVRVSGPAGTKEFLSSLLGLPGAATPWQPQRGIAASQAGLTSCAVA
jgi:hypothetical protein